MGGHFDIATKLTRIEELNDLINQEGFWNAQNDSVKITQELSNLKELVNQYQKLESDLDFCLDNFEIIKDAAHNGSISIYQCYRIICGNVNDSIHLRQQLFFQYQV